jgi:uncharacterized protein (TIGR02246 family)
VDRILQPRDLIDAIGDALNAKDAQTLGELFSEDAVFINVRGAQMRGRRAITEGHAVSFTGPLAGSTFDFDSVAELRVSYDVTVIVAHCLRGRREDASADTGPIMGTILQLVARRSSSGWEAVAASNVPELPR